MFRNNYKTIFCLILLATLFIGFALKIENVNAVLTVTVATDKAVYNPGENVRIIVTVKKDGTLSDGASVFVSVEPPGGGISGKPASQIPGPPAGDYTAIFSLSPSAGGGVYKVFAQATFGGESGSAQTTFTVAAAPAKKTVDWAVYNPSATPANPTTEDLVRLNVVLRIIATISPGPYPVDIVCFVDGVLVGGGTVTPSGTAPMTVYTDPRKYSAGMHTATWIIDPNHEYNDGNLGNNQVSFQFTVATPVQFDFSLTASPSTQTIKAGGTAIFNIAVNLVSGASSTVILSASGLPSTGVSSSFNPAQGNPSFSSILTISTTENAPLGIYTITITGVSGSLSRTAIITLTIESPVEPDFKLSITPELQTIEASQSTNYIISITGEGGFNSEVALVVSGLPHSIQASLTKSTGIPDYTSILTLTSSQTSSSGAYTFTIIASGGGKTKSITATLIIQAVSTPTFTASTSTTTTTPLMFGLFAGKEYLIILIALIAVIIVLALALAAAKKRGKSEKL
ncbi:MAG: hypothetical protein QXZ53_02920 [Candidatus Bathyarchaeia archaeon]